MTIGKICCALLFMNTTLTFLLCYNNRPAGQWVVMTAKIGGVEVMAVVYAWSQKRTCFIIASCGKTVTHDEPYVSKFENEFGRPSFKHLRRPAVAHMLLEFLPLIDEHNKHRQHILSLERIWLTTNPWTRIQTSCLGMSVVDTMRWDRNCRDRHANKDAATLVECFEGTDGDEVIMDLEVKEVSDFIGRPLVDGTWNYRVGPQPPPRRPRGDKQTDQPLVRVTNKEGKTSSKASPGKRERVCQISCLVCRLWGKTRNTQWKCADCGMGLCPQSVKRADNDIGRQYECLVEHHMSGVDGIRCPRVQQTHRITPAMMQYQREREAAFNGKSLDNVLLILVSSSIITDLLSYS